MIIQRLLVFLFVLTLIECNPIGEHIRKDNSRQRRSLDIRNWQFVDSLYKRFYKGDNPGNDDSEKQKRAETPMELRPVEGPISIEQLPAMLAARHVKRYPFSHEADPDIIGR